MKKLLLLTAPFFLSQDPVEIVGGVHPTDPAQQIRYLSATTLAQAYAQRSTAYILAVQAGLDPTDPEWASLQRQQVFLEHLATVGGFDRLLDWGK